MRGSTLQLRHREFVDAARLSGVRTTKILVAHILPNAMAPLVVQASFNYAEAILADAALSFLGLGVPPPTPTWGNMIASARTYLSVDPWFALFPGLAIVLAVMSLNLAGDSLRSLLGVSRQRSAAAARLGRFRPRGPKLASLPGEVGGDLMAPAGTGSGAGLQAGEGSHLTSDWS
jgi:peptide/nickel transport system permease protein